MHQVLSFRKLNVSNKPSDTINSINNEPTQTPTMDTDEPVTASCRLLTTYELLENILSHLPTDNLAQSQRVCRTWKNLIMRSLLLRQHLFLEPVSRKVGNSTNSVTSHHSNNLPFEPHPILLKKGSRVDKYSGPGESWCCELGLFAIKRMHEWTDKEWTTMLMTQPSLNKVSVCAYAKDGIRFYGKYFHDNHGIKMGVLVEALHRMTEFVDEPGAEIDFLLSIDVEVYY